MRNKISFGVFFPCYTFRSKRTSLLFNSLQESVIECENLGYNSVWLDDHLLLNKLPILECWTTLSALSRITKKIRLGTMVTCNSFRNPGLLAKMAATLDNISNGRLEMGIGAGVQKREHIAYGFTFSSSKIRIERLHESVEIIKKMWTEDKVSYNGRHYQITNAFCHPKPLQKPHPPVIIGGGGEKLTLKVTARLADRYDWGYIHSLKEYKHKMEILKKYCENVGRNFSDIEKSCWPVGQIFIGENKSELEKSVYQSLPGDVNLKEFMKTNFVGTPQECCNILQKYANLGVTYFMLFFGDFPDLNGLRVFAKQVIPRIK